MAKQPSGSVVSADLDEVKLPGDETDDDDQSPQDLNLNDLADKMDKHARSRAVERILRHHQSLRSDLDKMRAKLGQQAEMIAALEARLALVEEASAKQAKDTPAPKSPDTAKKGRFFIDI